MAIYCLSCEDIPVSLNATKSPEEPASRSCPFVLMQEFRLFCKKMGKRTTFQKTKQTNKQIKKTTTASTSFLNFPPAFPSVCLPTELEVTSAVTIRQRSAVSRRGQRRIQTHRSTCCWRSRLYSDSANFTLLLQLPSRHSRVNVSISLPKHWLRENTESPPRICSLNWDRLGPTTKTNTPPFLHLSPPPLCLAPPLLFSSILHCPVLRCWDWRCKWRWMQGSGSRVRDTLDTHGRELGYTITLERALVAFYFEDVRFFLYYIQLTWHCVTVELKKKSNCMFNLVHSWTLHLSAHYSSNLYTHVVQMFVPVGNHWDFPEVKAKQRFLERPPLAERVKWRVEQNRRFCLAVVVVQQVTF